jgi:GABA permease
MPVALYLVVANQTALSEELTQALLEKAKEEPGTEFILVVPASPVEHYFTHEEGQAREIAARRAGLALTHLTGAGVPIVGAHVGAPSVVVAIDDAIRERTSEYAGIIVCTFPGGVSRWLEPNLTERLQTAFHLPVTHIVSIHGHLMGTGRAPNGQIGPLLSG